jgi:hypothetical protein
VLGWAIGQKALDDSLARFGEGSPLSRLKTQLAGIDPDEAFSSIPYEKGARFVALLERTAGRDAFDRFLRVYMATFRFQSISTEEFLAFLDEKLPGVSHAIDANAWFYDANMPSNAPVFKSKALETLTKLAEEWPSGSRPTQKQIAAWTPAELLIYLQHLPRELDAPSLEWLDGELHLTSRGNHELLVEWLTIAAGSDYEPVFGKVREVLTRVGRMKYLRPLYTALGRHERTRALAAEIFAAAAPGYHQLSSRVVASVMGKYPG